MKANTDKKHNDNDCSGSTMSRHAFTLRKGLGNTKSKAEKASENIALIIYGCLPYNQL